MLYIWTYLMYWEKSLKLQLFHHFRSNDSFSFSLLATIAGSDVWQLDRHFILLLLFLIYIWWRILRGSIALWLCWILALRWLGRILWRWTLVWSLLRWSLASLAWSFWIWSCFRFNWFLFGISLSRILVFFQRFISFVALLDYCQCLPLKNEWYEDGAG